MTAIKRRGIAVLVLVALAACSDPATDDPTPKPQTSDPTTGPASAPQAGDVLWQTRPLQLRVIGVGRTGAGYVVATNGSTIGYSADGQQEWTVPEPAGRRRSGAAEVDGDVVVRSSLGGRGTHVRVLDGATGALRWERDVGGLVVGQGTLFTNSCGGDAGCTVTAIATATGRVRWQTPASDGLSILEQVGATVQATSFPFGTDRTRDPLGKRTLLQVFDARTGEQRGPDLLGNGFQGVGRVVIEADYSGSVGRDCTAELIARSLDGQERWRRTFDWTLARDDHDCALPLDVSPLAGGRVDVWTRGAFGVVLDATTGRTLWSYGGRRLLIDSAGGVDVVTDSAFRRFRGVDAGTHRPRWQAAGELSFDDDPAGFLGFTEDQDDGTEGFTLRSIRSGEESLTVTGRYVGSGDDWLATVARDLSTDQVSIVSWPH
ncbi:PQQ-binding-like beta-propeller repeat protein [Nocardioides sp.]|uniref:outer membrane protein assembly factor BamB family protein n=1 Tax=Nocardioides sp. TaxID=35761 RepID=UPI00271CEF1F|nr:PQQ-binding-like beta-propeller repeat protein [Nocardioides sp.]MDO9455708.1 PQQ-binding-like beta-propeller repeat protein [Nocardioides sp.]